MSRLGTELIPLSETLDYTKRLFVFYRVIIMLQRDNYPTQVKREKEERRRRREQGKNAQ